MKVVLVVLGFIAGLQVKMATAKFIIRLMGAKMAEQEQIISDPRNIICEESIVDGISILNKLAKVK